MDTRHPLAGQVFLGSAAIRDGLLTRAQLRSTAWRKLLHNVYTDAKLAVDHQLMASAAVLAIPAAVVAGRSAADLWGAGLRRGDDPVELIVPRRHRGIARPVRLHTVALDPNEVRRRPVPVTSPTRTARDVAAWYPTTEAVVTIDALLANGPLTLGDLHGARSAPERRVFSLVSTGAESPQETRLRLKVGQYGLPPPELQFQVDDEHGHVLARLDLAWPAAKVALEYDGRYHAEIAQFDRDRERLNRLTAAGWLVFHVTAGSDLDAVLCGVRSAISRRQGAL